MCTSNYHIVRSLGCSSSRKSHFYKLKIATIIKSVSVRVSLVLLCQGLARNHH
jgi:hypothetical protein